jgi:hypothetical protein
MMEPTALMADMSMMLAMLVDFPRCSVTQLDMESTMATTSLATTFFLMGAVLSLVAVLLLVPTLSIVDLNMMDTLSTIT